VPPAAGVAANLALQELARARATAVI